MTDGDGPRARRRAGTTKKRTVAAVAAALLAAGCSVPTSDAAAPTPAGSAGSAGSTGSTDLKGICPDPLVVQTAWYPDVTHSYYELLGDDYTVDVRGQRVTGPLVAPGPDGPVDTGVRIEIRAGGPAVNFVPTDELMWKDRSITFGEQGTDEALLAASRGRPVLSVFAPLDLDPLVFMWEADRYPDFSSVQDIGLTSTPVLTIKDDPSTLYLLATGVIRASQLAPGYDGSPRPWLARGGKAVLVGYATKDPYILSLLDGRRAIETSFVADAGYPNYRTTVSMRKDDRPALDSCLRRLVPIMQRAHVAFIADPDRQIALTVKLNAKYKTIYPYPEQIARAGYEALKRYALVFNGRDGRIGDFDLTPNGRINKFIDTLTPAYAGRGITLPPVRATDLATNDYLAPVGLP